MASDNDDDDDDVMSREDVLSPMPGSDTPVPDTPLSFLSEGTSLTSAMDSLKSVSKESRGRSMSMLATPKDPATQFGRGGNLLTRPRSSGSNIFPPISRPGSRSGTPEGNLRAQSPQENADRRKRESRVERQREFEEEGLDLSPVGNSKNVFRSQFSILHTQLSPHRRRVIPLAARRDDEWAVSRHKQLLQEKMDQLDKEAEQQYACAQLWEPFTRDRYACHAKQVGCDGDYCDIILAQGDIMHPFGETFKTKLPVETHFNDVNRGVILYDRAERQEAQDEKLRRQLTKPVFTEESAKAARVRRRRLGFDPDRLGNDSRDKFVLGQMCIPGAAKTRSLLQKTWAGHELPNLTQDVKPFAKVSPMRHKIFTKLSGEIVKYNSATVCTNCFKVYVRLGELRLGTEERKWSGIIDRSPSPDGNANTSGNNDDREGAGAANGNATVSFGTGGAAGGSSISGISPNNAANRSSRSPSPRAQLSFDSYNLQSFLEGVGSGSVTRPIVQMDWRKEKANEAIFRLQAEHEMRQQNTSDSPPPPDDFYEKNFGSGAGAETSVTLPSQFWMSAPTRGGAAIKTPADGNTPKGKKQLGRLTLGQTSGRASPVGTPPGSPLPVTTPVSGRRKKIGSSGSDGSRTPKGRSGSGTPIGNRTPKASRSGARLGFNAQPVGNGKRIETRIPS